MEQTEPTKYNQERLQTAPEVVKPIGKAPKTRSKDEIVELVLRNETVFEQITIGTGIYYKDKHKGIYNEKAELVGVWDFISKTRVRYHLF